MLEKMLEILDFLHKSSPDTAREYASIVYRTYPTAETQKRIEETLLRKSSEKSGNKGYKVYQPKAKSVQKKTSQPVVAAVANPAPPSNPAPSVEQEAVQEVVKDADPEPEPQVPDMSRFITMTEPEVIEEFGSLKDFKRYLRDHGYVIHNNANFSAIIDFLKRV